MKTIFNVPPTAQRGFLIPSSWQQVRRGLSRNLLKTMEYYHDRNIAVKKSHILVNLVMSPRLMWDAPLDRFYQNVVAQENALAHAFRFSSPILTGTVFDGEFYGKGTKEIIVACSDPFDVFEATTHWRDQEPVRVLKHAKTDLEMHIPNGVSYSNTSDVAVISVNIPMLLVMYRAFMKEQVVAKSKGYTPKNTSQFIHAYALTNMLPSHLDQAIFNRLAALAMGDGQLQQTTRKHIQAMENMDASTDKVLKEIIQFLKQNDMHLQDMFGHIPTVTACNMLDAMKLPNNAPTRQYAWVEAVARLVPVVTMAMLAPSGLVKLDRSMIESMLTKMRYTSSTEQIMAKLGKDGEDYKFIAESLDAMMRR